MLPHDKNTAHPTQQSARGEGGIDLSSTVIVVKPSEGMKTLMVQRAATMGFAAKAMVFPGGKVDPADFSADWKAFDGAIDGLMSQLAPSTDDQPAVDHTALLALAVCAIRELFEETGVLLCKYNDKYNGKYPDAAHLTDLVGNLVALRGAINEDASLFLPFLIQNNFLPAFEDLTLYARWLTPRQSPRRFDTWFFIAQMPEGQHALADGAESLSAEWQSAKGFLDMCAEGKRKLIFPTVRNLERLAGCSSYEALLADAQAHKVGIIEPAVEVKGGEPYLTIPEGCGYPVTQEPLKTAMRG